MNKTISPFYITVFSTIILNLSLSAVALKDPKGNFESLVSYSTAPKSYEEIQEIKFPTNADVELDFKGMSEGKTIGPDGGNVILLKKGTYNWTLAKGGKVTYWSSSNWIFSQDKYSFHVHAENGGTLPKNFRVTFTDGTRLSQDYHIPLETIFYYYEDQFKNNYFHIYPPRFFGSLKKEVGRFDFYYDAQHEAWIDSFLEGKSFSRFEEYIKKYGYVSSNKMPVFFFSNAITNQKYLRNPKASCTGGMAGIGSISFCFSTPISSYIGQSTEAKLKSKAVHPTYMLFHEWGHHLLQVQCTIHRRDQKFPKSFSSEWFNEGIPEYMGYLGSSKKRGIDRITFFEKFVMPNKSPSLSKDDAYLLGGQLFQYIAQKYGDKMVYSLWESSCKGEKEEAIFEKLLGRAPQAVMNALFVDLMAVREGANLTKFWRDTLEDWSVDAVSLDFENPDSILIDLSDVNIKPNLSRAFLLDVKLITGKLAGHFTTPRKELVNLFISGTYTIKGPNYDVTVSTSGSITFKGQGHKITQWPSGQLVWKTPDGKMYNQSRYH